MILRAALQSQRTVPSSCRGFGLVRSFHATPFRRNEPHDHYEALELPVNAEASEIKKQFYKLSKANHPDLRPNDPAASDRFLRISEAYATLGNAEKRARYDRDVLRTRAPSAAASSHPGGSFSSASTPAGGRPPSGLSRRRTQFRGPPPSFYSSGGWGNQGNKRAEHAGKASHSHEAQGQSQSGPEGPAAAGTGPGGFAQGFGNDVPHFDQDGHLKRHSEIEKSRHKSRTKHMGISEEDLEASRGNSGLFNFLVMSGVLATIYGISVSVLGLGSANKAKAEKEKQEKAEKDKLDKMGSKANGKPV